MTPSPSESPDKPDRGAQSAAETYGPLDIERRLKDDGRVLILYARRERPGR